MNVTENIKIERNDIPAIIKIILKKNLRESGKIAITKANGILTYRKISTLNHGSLNFRILTDAIIRMRTGTV